VNEVDAGRDHKRRRKGDEGEGGKKSNVIGSKRGEID
jgi:hypothetical protein